MAFDPTKPVQTRDGRKVRILATDRKGDYPIAAMVFDKDGYDVLMLYSSKGEFVVEREGSCLDLVNIPETEITYALVNKSGVVACNRPDLTSVVDSRRFFPHAVAIIKTSVTGNKVEVEVVRTFNNDI